MEDAQLLEMYSAATRWSEQIQSVIMFALHFHNAHAYAVNDISSTKSC